MSARPPEPAAPETDPQDVAARWFARQRSGAMTDEARLELREWLMADPAHAAAYAAVRRAWGGSGSVKSDPRVLAMREHWKAAPAPPRRWISRRAVAASLLAVVLAGGALAGWRIAIAPRPLADRLYSTAVGEQRVVELPDGSVVTLNTDTVLRTRRDKDRRLLYLDSGQAFFKVAHDAAHPFVVTAGGRTVTALGTAFDVRLDKGAFQVTLVEGKVRVASITPAAPTRAAPDAPSAPPPQPALATEMVAGSQLIAPPNEDWRIKPANVVEETSWTKGRLIFDRERLADVVAEMNRYSDRKIVLADAGLGDAPISGTFKPGDVMSFVAAMEDYRMARRGREDRTSVELLPY